MRTIKPIRLEKILSGLALLLGSSVVFAGGPPVSEVSLDLSVSPMVATKTATKGTANLGEAVANNKFVDVACDAGYVIVGCGVELGGSSAGGVIPANNQDLADHVTILENRPLGGASKCRARAHETPVNGLTNAKGWKITAWAICLKIDAQGDAEVTLVNEK